jgi:hypothetical protein
MLIVGNTFNSETGQCMRAFIRYLIYLPINAIQLNYHGLTRFCAIDLHRLSKGPRYSTARPQDYRVQPH